MKKATRSAIEFHDQDLLNRHRGVSQAARWALGSVILLMILSILWNNGQVWISVGFWIAAAVAIVPVVLLNQIRADLESSLRQLRAFDSIPPYQVGQLISLYDNPSGLVFVNLVAEVLEVVDDSGGRARIVRPPLPGARSVRFGSREWKLAEGDEVLFEFEFGYRDPDMGAGYKFRHPFITDKCVSRQHPLPTP